MPVSDSSHLTALIIIANEERRYSLDNPLCRAGFTISHATNGEDGLRLAMEAPHLILLDLDLPDMTGFEVCCRLKSHAATASIPVLHLSEFPVESSQITKHLEEGNEAYLTYPVVEAELLSFVNTLIRGRQAQRQFSSFLEAAPDAVVIFDQDCKIVRVNQQTEQMFGYRREELIGEDVTILLPERFLKSHPRHRADYLAQPYNRQIETSLNLLGLRKEGSEFPVEIGLSPIPDIDGILIACIVRDTTERRKTELALRESEERFRRVVTLMPSGVYTVDVAGVIDFYNEKAAAMWGRKPDLGDTDERFCGSARLFQSDGTPMPHEQTPVASAVQEGSSVNGLDVMIERPDLSRIQVRVNVAPIRDGADNIIGAINVFDDVTRRHSAEVALRTSEIRYRRLFQTAKDGILILDAETGRITDANPFMIDLLGYSHDHFLGKELWEIGLFSDKSANEAAVRELQHAGYIRYEHLPLETSTGKRVEVEIVANSYAEGDHRVIQCNVRDITERSRMEHLLREQAIALENLHRRKDEFLAMLSHELRNPLSPIASALQLLGLQKNEAPLQQKARTIIERQVGQLTRLIDDLLEVSRITTGRIHIQQERVALNAIVEHAVETVRPKIVRHQHALTVSLPKEPIWLFADAARLEQVVVNLLTNAAKFTNDAGQISLTVRQEGNECVLRVRDNGIGIAPETLPHVFDLFTQAEKSLDRSQGGLGIGLALVQRIVEMHRGRVEAFSTLRLGSEFVVYLPTMSAEATDPSLMQEGISPPNEHSLRVLIVDDNEDAAQTLGMLLMTSGHEVLTVHDGPCSLAAAQDFSPDVVLLDIGLPGMDGYEVATRLREQSIFTNVLLVAMTGYGQDSDRRRSKEAGFDHHFVKPLNFRKLEQLLATVSEKTI